MKKKLLIISLAIILPFIFFWILMCYISGEFISRICPHEITIEDVNCSTFGKITITLKNHGYEPLNATIIKLSLDSKEVAFNSSSEIVQPGKSVYLQVPYNQTSNKGIRIVIEQQETWSEKLHRFSLCGLRANPCEDRLGYNCFYV